MKRSSRTKCPAAAARFGMTPGSMLGNAFADAGYGST
jgi:hypothetical protein